MITEIECGNECNFICRDIYLYFNDDEIANQPQAVRLAWKQGEVFDRILDGREED